MLVDSTIERDWGWVFYYNSALFLESGNISDALAGNSPYIVNRSTGEIQVTGTAHPIESGLFFALWGTASKLSYALAVGIAFPLLDLAGFSATAVNSASSLTWLAVLYGAPCILFKLAAVWTMRKYPITQEVHADIRRQLEERRISVAQV